MFKSKVILLAWFFLISVAGQAKEAALVVPAKKVGSTFKFKWDYQDFPVKLELFSLQNPKFARVGMMGKLKSKVNDFLASQISSEEMYVPEGDLVKFAIVVHNTTAKKIYFHLVPHEITPPEYSLGAKFICMCFGHIYSVPPGQYFYRIVSLQNVTPQVGREFTIRHKVIAIDPKDSFKDSKEYLDDREVQ